MDWYDTWLQGAWLAAWGCALLLAYTGGARLANIAHVRLFAAGKLPRPTKVWPPVHRQRDVWTACAGVVLAIGVIVASNPMAADLLGTPHFPLAALRDVTAGLIRAHVGLFIELFFLRLLAENPDFKLNWVVAWYAFSVGLAFGGE